MKPSTVIQASVLIGCTGVVIVAGVDHGLRGVGMAMGGLGFAGAVLSPFFTYLAPRFFDDDQGRRER